ncbi:MAG: hypothetical protein OEW58_02920 [Gammaproteobacteria bacterium]|nr:hypothetical protein [Gammaproteobacteria bacterium]
MQDKEPLGAREGAVYILIGIGSLLMISYLPHMFLDGLIEDETKVQIQIGVTLVWALILGALGWDIIKRRNS